MWLWVSESGCSCGCGYVWLCVAVCGWVYAHVLPFPLNGLDVTNLFFSINSAYNVTWMYCPTLSPFLSLCTYSLLLEYRKIAVWKQLGMVYKGKWLLVGCCSSVARALAAKARCPGFDSQRRHFLFSPMSFQRSMDSNNIDCVLF